MKKLQITKNNHIHKNICCVLLFMSFNVSIAQDFTTVIQGRVYSKNGDVTAIHISNISRKKGTITDVNGYFSINAQINDTLVFSAVQFKKKSIVVTYSILKSKSLLIKLEETITKLNEVVVTPYHLSGEISRDLNNIKIAPLITASTEGLPNAYVKPPTQSQRKLYTARTLEFKIVSIKVDPLINYFSGRTKMLKKRVALDAQTKLIQNLRRYYADSSYIKNLKIEKTKIENFLYFCITDTAFTSSIKADDKLKLWQIISKKSAIYRSVNNLD